MGANFSEYLREAYRTLKLDGDLHVIEATSRFTNRDGFVECLKQLGFAVVSVEDKWKFTHIRALKTERMSHNEVEYAFEACSIVLPQSDLEESSVRVSLT
jgi:ubiquinone/menaquinone biosynthesis C-methylase UbiE